MKSVKRKTSKKRTRLPETRWYMARCGDAWCFGKESQFDYGTYQTSDGYCAPSDASEQTVIESGYKMLPNPPSWWKFTVKPKTPKKSADTRWYCDQKGTPFEAWCFGKDSEFKPGTYQNKAGTYTESLYTEDSMKSLFRPGIMKVSTKPPVWWKPKGFKKNTDPIPTSGATLESLQKSVEFVQARNTGLANDIEALYRANKEIEEQRNRMLTRIQVLEYQYYNLREDCVEWVEEIKRLKTPKPILRALWSLLRRPLF